MPGARPRLARIAALLALLTAAVVAANVWVFKHRLEGYAFRQSDYATVYLPSEAPTVAGFGRAPDGALLMRFSADSDPRLRPAAGEHLRLQSPPGQIVVHDVASAARPQHPARIYTMHDPAEGVSLGTPDLLIGAWKRHPLRALVADVEDYDPAHVAAARAELAKLGLDKAQGTQERLRVLWQFLRRQLGPHEGAPPPRFARESPWTQYQRTIAGETKIFCANFAEILAFFATVAGLPARVVDSVGTLDGVPYGAHAFVEVFIAEEQRWAYTDLMLGIFMVRAGKDGPPLNTVQLTQLVQARAENALWVTGARTGELADVPYASLSPSPSLHFHPSVLFVFHRDYGANRYRLATALQRYLFSPEPAYGLHFGNGRAAIKLALLCALGTLIAAWAALAWLWFRRPDVS